MENEFVPYNLSLRLKEIGFDKPCFGWYEKNSNFYYCYQKDLIPPKPSKKLIKGCCLAPTFSQAFRWFRNMYDLDGEATRYNISRSEAKILNIDIKQTKHVYVPIINGVDLPELEYMTYFLLKEKTQLVCLEKLIEIVESKSEKNGNSENE